MEDHQLRYFIEEFRIFKTEQAGKLDLIHMNTIETTRQTTMTNGRVTALERSRLSMEEDIEILKAISGENKGRDKMILWVLGLTGAILAILIGWIIH